MAFVTTPAGCIPRGFRGDAVGCYQTEFKDTVEGVKAMLAQDCVYDLREARYIADPYVHGCWLVISKEHKLAVRAYVNPHEWAPEFEEVDYDQAVERYG